MTREQWLTQAAAQLGPWVAEVAEKPLPPLSIMVSWPHGRNTRTTIGQCFPPKWTEDGTVFIGISPVLGHPCSVLETLVHELVHAVGIMNHGSAFKKVAETIGLTGKMTATKAGPKLHAKLYALAGDLGAYPHTAMRNPGMENGEPKRPGWPQYISPVEPSYKVQIRPALIDMYGAPICPISGLAMVLREK